jgi:hypothetical protein
MVHQRDEVAAIRRGDPGRGPEALLDRRIQLVEAESVEAAPEISEPRLGFALCRDGLKGLHPGTDVAAHQGPATFTMIAGESERTQLEPPPGAVMMENA